MIDRVDITRAKSTGIRKFMGNHIAYQLYGWGNDNNDENLQKITISLNIIVLVDMTSLEWNEPVCFETNLSWSLIVYDS